MGASCCRSTQPVNPAYKKILWIVLVINLAMFLTEFALGLASGSTSLQADALDFFGDAANYGISLFVAGLALHHRARAAFVKGVSMGLFGLWVVGSGFWHFTHGTVPEAATMAGVGGAALFANALAFALLWQYRTGDSNMRSVWLCTRNDVIGNCAVLLAAFGVFGTARGWPDALVAVTMGALGVQGAWVVTRTASRELENAHA